MELHRHYVEATKRGLRDSIKECSFLLYSASLQDSAEIRYSELPLHAYVRTLSESQNYSEIITMINSSYYTDPVLVFFYAISLLKTNCDIKNYLSLNDPFVNFWYKQLFILSAVIKISLAKFEFESKNYQVAISILVDILGRCPFFWEAWKLLIFSIQNSEQFLFATNLLFSTSSLMSLHAALLLHIRIRNSETRRLFLSLQSKVMAEINPENPYASKILQKFSISDYDFKNVSDREFPFKLEIPDIYSDYLFVTFQKEQLKIFAREVSNTKSWTKESCYVIANLYSLMQQHDVALIWLKRALIIDPNYEAALIILGNEYLELKSPSDAIHAYTLATRVNPLNYRCYFSLASIYFLLDDLDQCIYFLKKTIKLESSDYRAFELMAECYHCLGFPEHAIEHLNLAISCPNSPNNLYKKLALIYESIGNSKSYTEFYKKYFEISIATSKTDIFEFNDASDCSAVSNIFSNSNFRLENAVAAKLKAALLRYNSGNIAFDYSELQIAVRSITNSSSTKSNGSKLLMILESSFESSSNCQEIIEVIIERIKSPFSSTENILNTLSLLEALLLQGSEKFIALATNHKQLVQDLASNANEQVKSRIESIIKLETDREYLYNCRKMKEKMLPNDKEEIEYNIGSTDGLNILN